MYRFILILSLLVQASSAFIQCTEDICDDAEQPPLHCKGGIIMNGGWCGCTDVCAKQRGEPCGWPRIPVTELLLGGPPPPRCDQGLRCVHNVCV
ncbi:equistatin-like [Elysia marginata]|uniref:Equistatin-like n=1 Tax=Elysia marginata TaxID=1093978 RepID=A0AAV4FE42_9GAST|nr:equistatin-like [Elysia marginata]